jgi:hypothetical protein
VIGREDVPEVEPVEARPEPVTQWTSVAGTVLGILILVGIVAVAIFGLFQIYPDDVVEPDDADFLDNIFANKFVLFAARLVLFSLALVAFFAAGFAILSVVQWIKNGQWLRRAGPFEVAEQAVSTLQDQIDLWKGIAESTGQELEELRERLQETDQLVEKLYENVTVLENENDDLRDELQARPPS